MPESPSTSEGAQQQLPTLVQMRALWQRYCLAWQLLQQDCDPCTVCGLPKLPDLVCDEFDAGCCADDDPQCADVCFVGPVSLDPTQLASGSVEAPQLMDMAFPPDAGLAEEQLHRWKEVLLQWCAWYAVRDLVAERRQAENDAAVLAKALQCAEGGVVHAGLRVTRLLRIPWHGVDDEYQEVPTADVAAAAAALEERVAALKAEHDEVLHADPPLWECPACRFLQLQDDDDAGPREHEDACAHCRGHDDPSVAV